MLVYKELVPCRYLELCDVPMANVSDDCRKLTIARDKNGNERELPIPEVMVSYFQRMRAWGSPWAFARPFSRGGIVTFQKFGLNTISQIFRKIRDRHGWSKDLVFRKLRHTAISGWLRKFDIDLVSEVAGASPETLAKYYDVVSIEDKLKAADSFAREVKIIPFSMGNETLMRVSSLEAV
jgi:integrase